MMMVVVVVMMFDEEMEMNLGDDGRLPSQSQGGRQGGRQADLKDKRQRKD